MTKYEWTKKQMAEATAECPPDNRQYIDAFLREVQDAGDSLTRSKFFDLLKKCAPAIDDDAGYFDYEVLHDCFLLGADFREAWKNPETQPLPRITTASRYGKVNLPDDFCTLGGAPEWVQNEDYPICEECDANMVLFLQLKSLPYELTKKTEELEAFTFGDAGNFYVFHCPNCRSYKTSWQCH